MGNSEIRDGQLWHIETRAVGAGAISGFVAGIGMGLLLQFGTELLPVFGAFAGRTSLLRGWVVHLVISVLYGVFFAFVVAYPAVQSFMGDFGDFDYVLAAIVYATMIAAGTIALLPFVFELPWVTNALQAQYEEVPGPLLGGLAPAAVFSLGHLVYGFILGAVYTVIGEAS